MFLKSLDSDWSCRLDAHLSKQTSISSPLLGSYQAPPIQERMWWLKEEGKYPKKREDIYSLLRLATVERMFLKCCMASNVILDLTVMGPLSCFFQSMIVNIGVSGIEKKVAFIMEVNK